MFKTFFTKVGTWFKGLPSNAVKALLLLALSISVVGSPALS